MMKKRWWKCCCVFCLLVACSPKGKTSATSPTTNSVQSILEQKASGSEQKETANPTNSSNSATPEKQKKEEPLKIGLEKGIDLDLAPFSANAVYAEVVRILQERDGYIGKSIRILGQFTSFKGETGEAIPMVVVSDMMGCCMQGMEMRIKEDNYPEGYPEVGSRILVTGVVALRTAYNGYEYPYIQVEKWEAV